MAKKLSSVLFSLILITAFFPIISAEVFEKDPINNGLMNNYKKLDENTTHLDIEFRQIVGHDVNITIINTGEHNATGVSFELSISGGIFGLIDEKIDGILVNPLQPGEEYIVKLPVFGLGKADIVAKTNASNADNITKMVKGFVFFNFVITFGK